MLIDAAGAERVVLGTDWPFDMGAEDGAAWVRGLGRLTGGEKEAVLGGNAAGLLGL